MNDEVALPLEGLYLHLVQAGFPVSARDYDDALEALRRGHGLGRRDRLLWLVTTLWARGDLEATRLEALFRQLPHPRADEVRALTGGERRANGRDTPVEKPVVDDVEAVDDAEGAAAEAAPLIEFSAADSGSGGLPSLQHRHVPARHYAYAARPLLSQRTLTIAWRRLRRTQRSGPKTELDVAATVAERCRRGFVLEPVLVQARRNQLRLVVLVDASASMLPWRRMNSLLAASLAAGQLARMRLLYFDNDPREALFDTDARIGRHAFETVLRDEAGSVAIVVGDAGAARGRNDRERVAGTREFLRAARAAWSRLAWLNPMPQRRWVSTSAARTALDPACGMFELNDAGLARAVEHLRA